jgi:hypothetical protein
MGTDQPGNRERPMNVTSLNVSSIDGVGESTTGKGTTSSRAAKALRSGAALAAAGWTRSRDVRTAVLLVCVCAVVSTRANAQASGGPLHCKWVFVGTDWRVWTVSKLPKEFVRTRARHDHSLVSEEPSLEGLKTYFQKAKNPGSNLAPHELHWEPFSLVYHDHKQLPFLQCPPFFTI